MADEAEPADGVRRLAGRYRVEGLLGQGGMSEVFHGFDERLSRRVAIKMLKRPDTGFVPSAPYSPEAVEILEQLRRDEKRFLREIHTTALLELPGIPAVYDTGVETTAHGGARVWVVMQLLRGSTLEALLDRADYLGDPPPVAWAASIAAQIAAVLADVHRVDVIHRDVKPANIMIVDGGLVKVLDFGVAILRGAGSLPRLTQIGRTVGTPSYMSPEQWRGGAVTASSDIYSLGCLLFEMLTGDLPFHATTSEELRIRHLRSEAESPTALRTDVPESVDTLVASMLDKDPERRPSADAVYEALLPVALGGSPGSDERRDPTRPFRRPLLAALGDAEAVDGLPKLTDDEAERLQANARVLLDDDRTTEAIRLLDAGLARTDDPFLSLRLRHLLAAALYVDGELTRAASMFDAAGREYRKHLPPNDQLVLDCAYHAGHAYAETGKSDKALAQLRFYVLNADRTADDDEAAKVRESRYVIAQMLAADGEPEEALDELHAVRGLIVEAFGPESTQARNLDRQIRRVMDEL